MKIQAKFVTWNDGANISDMTCTVIPTPTKDLKVGETYLMKVEWHGEGYLMKVFSDDIVARVEGEKPECEHCPDLSSYVCIRCGELVQGKNPQEKGKIEPFEQKYDSGDPISSIPHGVAELKDKVNEIIARLNEGK